MTLAHKQSSLGTASTVALGSATFASLCAGCGLSHPRACCQWPGGGWQPHTYSGCKLTSESQLCCFSASGHFHVGLGSFCETSLECAWGSLSIPLRQGPLPPWSIPWKGFVGTLCTWHWALERDKADGQARLQGLTTLLILTALLLAGWPRGWVVTITKGQQLQGRSNT